MIDYISKLWRWFQNLHPLWLRALVSLLVGGVLFLFSLYPLSSCGQMVKVTVRDTPNGVTISTTQTSKDSSGTNININPNINFNK